MGPDGHIAPVKAEGRVSSHPADEDEPAARRGHGRSEDIPEVEVFASPFGMYILSLIIAVLTLNY